MRAADLQTRAAKRVVALGLRGIPDVPGGVETHAQNLYPALVELGWRVTVLCRSPFFAEATPPPWRGIARRRLWSPRASGAEALLHTTIGVLWAAWQRPDILHLHAIGPAVLTPLARLLGLRVVVTHHGRDYDRQKWGGFAKWLLRRGEACAARWAAAVICVSAHDAKRLSLAFPGSSIHAIPNGVPPAQRAEGRQLLASLGLRPGRYVLNVARLVGEKRQDDLIQAFLAGAPSDVSLVLAGGSQHGAEYERRLHELAKGHSRVIFAGFRTGADLAALYSQAGCFVLASSHEGLPIALLEAMSYGLPCLASDIAANLEVGLPAQAYFPLGDTGALADRLGAAFAPAHSAEFSSLGQHGRALAAAFDWSLVADRTDAVLRAVTQQPAISNSAN